MITREYKGHAIIFDETDETWNCEGLSNPSIKALMIELDKARSKSFTRTRAFAKHRWHGSNHIEEVEITSANAARTSFRVSWLNEKGSNTEEPSSNIFAYTPDNEALYNEIAACTAAIKHLEDERSALVRTLTPFVMPN